MIAFYNFLFLNDGTQKKTVAIEKHSKRIPYSFLLTRISFDPRGESSLNFEKEKKERKKKNETNSLMQQTVTHYERQVKVQLNTRLIQISRVWLGKLLSRREPCNST